MGRLIVRHAFGGDLAFSDKDRVENIRRIRSSEACLLMLV